MSTKHERLHAALENSGVELHQSAQHTLGDLRTVQQEIQIEVEQAMLELRATAECFTDDPVMARVNNHTASLRLLYVKYLAALYPDQSRVIDAQAVFRSFLEEDTALLERRLVH